jgi:hypothetical protein
VAVFQRTLNDNALVIIVRCRFTEQLVAFDERFEALYRLVGGSEVGSTNGSAVGSTNGSAVGSAVGSTNASTGCSTGCCTGRSAHADCLQHTSTKFQRWSIRAHWVTLQSFPSTHVLKTLGCQCALTALQQLLQQCRMMLSFLHTCVPYTCVRGSLCMCLLQVKLWAEVHNLNEPKNGTLNSWSLTQMVRCDQRCCSHATYTVTANN